MTDNQTPAIEFYQLDPRGLTIGKNARVDVTLDPEFVADIAENGVMTAITATRDENGTVTVLQGQRRTLAAVEAGLATVPVMIVGAPTDEADRIVRQVAENDRRAAMSDVDRVAVAADLALMGYTPAQIATRTRRPRAEVDAALVVAGNEQVRQRLADELTLFEAEALAEFSDDPEAVAQVEQTIERGWDVSHTIARIREDREEAAILTDALAKIKTATGYDAAPYHCDADPIRNLRTRDREPIRAADHLSCPGNVVTVSVYGARERAEHPGRMPFRVFLCCADAKKHGHLSVYDLRTGTGKTQPSTEERRAIREGNKAWRAAETVRREWLAKLAKTAKLPKGAEKVMAGALARGRVGDATGWALLTGRGNIDHWGQPYRDAVAAIEKMTPGRAAVAALVMCLVEQEKATAEVQTWRNPGTSSTQYLRTLAGWGYPLSEAEDAFCRKTEQAEATTEDEAAAEPIDDEE